MTQPLPQPFRPFALLPSATHRAIGLLLALWVAPLFAQTPTVPVGEEFQVNTTTASSQNDPKIGMKSTGDFVVVWRSDNSAGTDTDNQSIQGQRFAPDGSAVGSEFQVNTYTFQAQSYPDVGLGPDGDFVVVWMSYGSEGTDTSSYSIHGQRYGSNGEPAGGEFQVNTYTTGYQYYPHVGMDAEGAFVVVWDSPGSDGTDTDGSSIQAQRYASDGSPLGGEFQVNTYTTDDQCCPALAVMPDGSFVAAWKSFASAGTDSDGTSIQAQRFDAGGATQGGQFQVNTVTTGGQSRPFVALGPDGEFILVWDSDSSNGTDSSFGSIQARRYDSEGSPVGDQFQVNVYTPNGQGSPALAVDPDGDFVVSWVSSGSSGTDTDVTSVQARRFISDGAPLGDQFQVNAYTSSFQTEPQVASDGNGDFVISFESRTSGGTDVNISSIQARRYRATADIGDLVFSDLDADGLQEVSEPGVEGVSVHLFEEGGPLLDSTVTDSDGAFLFRPKIALAGVADQFYLQFEEPADGDFTTADVGEDDAIDSDADPVSGETGTITISTAGAEETDWDAGLVARAKIGDRVWLDDGDGLQVGGEPGVQNVTVSLFTSDDSLLDTTSTDATGSYEFFAEAGDYYLEFTAPGGTTFAPRDQGGNDAVDSDVFVSTGTTAVFTVTSGQVDGTWDAGLETDSDDDGVADRIDNCPDDPNPDQADGDDDGTGDACEPPPMAQVGDRVWLDANANGVQNGGENGVAGVTVNLYREPDPPFLTGKASTLAGTIDTDVDGYYAFTVDPGTYYLEFVCSEESFTALDQGASDALDSDVEPTTATTVPFALGDGAADGTWDAGLLDPDVDGVACSDNCPGVANAGQEDDDVDGFGDACDVCAGSDDGVDTDDDTVPDGCDLCTGDDASGDSDADGTCDDSDTCTDSDDDGFGDPGFPGNVCATDNCPADPNADQADADEDGVGDVCDLCEGDDATGDSDSDGVCDDSDLCPGFDDDLDADGDGVPDVCDVCQGDDAAGDSDGDGICADLDCDDGDPTNACFLFGDGFESGDTTGWSSVVGAP